MSSSITFDHVTKTFPVRGERKVPDREFTAVRDVSFEIAAGEFTVLVGPSGCGKSTLLDLLAGLTAPSGGRILVDGRPVTGPGLDRGVVFQQYALLPWRDARGNVEFGLEARVCRSDQAGSGSGVWWRGSQGGGGRHGGAMSTDDNAGGTSRAPSGATGERRGTRAREPGKIRTTDPKGAGRRERRERAEEFLDLVGLTGFGDRYPHELSGGMRQRVAIARSLAFDPDVLLMDEPFAALDAQTRELLQEELLSIWQRTGKTVVFITHSIDEAVYLGQRVAVLTSRPGRVKEVVPIGLGERRTGDVRSSAAFGEARHHVWTLLQDEVRQAASGASGAAGVRADVREGTVSHV